MATWTTGEFMKNVWTALIGTLAIVVLVGFQNCSGKSFDGAGAANKSSTSDDGSNGAASAANPNGTSTGGPGSTTWPSSPTTTVNTTPVANGSTISNAAGQSLSFVNNMGNSIGNATIVNGTGNIMVNLYDSRAGRRATVIIAVDPTTGKFLSVKAAPGNPPYMCHSASDNMCNNWPNLTSGSMESNCNSPINFTGSLNGSVNNLTDTAWTTYCSGASTSSGTQLCTLALAGGGSGSTYASNGDCQTFCRNNANLNPGNPLTCTFNGQRISY